MFATKLERWNRKKLPPMTVFNTPGKFDVLLGEKKRNARPQLFYDKGEGKIQHGTENFWDGAKNSKNTTCMDKVTLNDATTKCSLLDCPINEGNDNMLPLRATQGGIKHLDASSNTPATPKNDNDPHILATAHTAESHEQTTPTDAHMAGLHSVDDTDGLRPPLLRKSSAPVTGMDKDVLRRENKKRRCQTQAIQPEHTFWSETKGDFFLPDDLPTTGNHRNGMCPAGLARLHPAGDLLETWSQLGCPTMTGKPWTLQQMTEAIQRGPHVSATTPEAMEHFEAEIQEKVAAGQARTVLWDEIKANPPPQLKISPIAAIPHKSKAYRSILDLSFSLALRDGTRLPAVNETTTKTAPMASVDQLGHSLARLIHAFAEAREDDKIFMAKWDVKDGFWRLDCQEGEEYNFAYVLPQPPAEPVTLVIPTSLQMGWIESPGFFCAASETSRDVAAQYCQTPVGSLPHHKFTQHMTGSESFKTLPYAEAYDLIYKFLLEVFVDDFMSIVIATSQRQLLHVGTATMMGIHDVFPSNAVAGEDPISEKKMLKNEAQFDTTKTLLGFDFDGVEKTLWLASEKRDALLLILKSWIRSSARAHAGIPFNVFESVTAKLRHAFTALPAGKGLLSPCNKILALRPHTVFVHKNHELRVAIMDIRTLLQASTNEPTKCRELVMGHPHVIGYSDASRHGFGGIVIGEEASVPPTVVRGQWPPDIRQELVSQSNPHGRLTINDLEMAGMLLLWFVMEAVTSDMQHMKAALFSDNSPTVSWIERLASRRSLTGARLVRALALRLKVKQCCPLTPLHVAGTRNSMADMASRSFGRVPKWYCKTQDDFSRLFNSLFPLPLQNTWNIFHLNNKLFMRVISILRMKDSTLAEWQRIPKIGQNIGTAGAPMSNLWAWTLSLNAPHTRNEHASSPDLQLEQEPDTTAEDDKSKLHQCLQLSRPLARRSLWNVRETLPK